MTKRFTHQQIYDGISEHEQFYDNHKRMRYDEVCDKLNEQDERIKELEEENHYLEFELGKHIGDGEWDIRDITCMAGKFRLEEWGERYHQFYDEDTELEDEAVVIMLLENKNLIEELKKENKELKEEIAKFKEWEKHIRGVRREDLDRVFKMSVYEIAETFGYYEERIKKIEKELLK